VADERSCEAHTCNIDQRTFKGFLHRWMAATGQLVPALQPSIQATLKQSVASAVKTCTGGPQGNLCSFHWAQETHNSSWTGPIEQMSVLGALLSLMVPQTSVPVTNTTGGTSVGNPDAGSDSRPPTYIAPASTGDRAGGGILTAMVVIAGVGVCAWMNFTDGEDSDKNLDT
jgi:mannan endo-1,6-alpha-mannosidase